MQCPVSLHKVVREVVQRDRSGMVFNLPTECVRQTPVAPDAHAHTEILTFHEAGADLFRIGIPDLHFLLAPKARRRGSTALWGPDSSTVLAVNLLNDRVVYDG